MNFIFVVSMETKSPKIKILKHLEFVCFSSYARKMCALDFFKCGAYVGALAQEADGAGGAVVTSNEVRFFFFGLARKFRAGGE